MWERLSPAARQVMDLARDEAATLGQPYIGDEHVLVGLLRYGRGDAARLLEGAGLDAAHTVAALRRLQDQGLTPSRTIDQAASLRAIGVDVETVHRLLAAAYGAEAVGRAVRRASRRPWWRGGGRRSTPLCGPALLAKRAVAYAVEVADTRAGEAGPAEVSCEDLLDGVLRDIADAGRLRRGQRRELRRLGWRLVPDLPAGRLLSDLGIDPVELRTALRAGPAT